MDESVMLRDDGLYCWQGPKMGKTLFNAKVGALVLTNHRLLFLSAGRSDVGQRLATSLVSVSAANRTRGSHGELDFTDLANAGSWAIPLADLSSSTFVKKTFSSYLTLGATDRSGAQHWWAVSTKYTMPRAATWEAELGRARAAFGH